jgi:NDP-sugar pyrophosphorylase family protein
MTGNALTIATHARTVKIDYGVRHLNGESRLEAYGEKPESPMVVSMGVYVVEPRVLEYIPEDVYFDFPSLVKKLLEAGERVGAYRYEGFWLDIGRHEDYEQATSAWEALTENGVAVPPARARQG